MSRALFIDNAQHSVTNTNSSELHQLLVILSDGRGVFAEGTLVRQQNNATIHVMFCVLVYSNCSQEASRTRCLCSLYNIRSTTQGVLLAYILCTGYSLFIHRILY